MFTPSTKLAELLGHRLVDLLLMAQTGDGMAKRMTFKSSELTLR
jgi:hypothetical protein